MLHTHTVLHDRYQVLQPIRRNRHGGLYKAADLHTNATVTLKQIVLTPACSPNRVATEAQLLTDLRHPAIPTVEAQFGDETSHYLVMEYIPGDDLAALMTRNGGTFPAADIISWVLRWADQVLDVLEYLHSQNPPVLHRNIKPQNMKLTARGNLLLLDFGLAAANATQTTSLSAEALPYTPLEKLRGNLHDARSDLYELSATLYHLLTGVSPTDAATRMEALLNNQPDPLRAVDELNRAVSPTLAAIVKYGLALDPDARPASAAILRRALRGVRATISPGSAVSFPALNPTAHALLRGSPLELQQPQVAPVAAPVALVEVAPAAPGTLLHTFQTGDPVLCAALCPSGEILALAGTGRMVTSWHLDNGRVGQHLESQTQTIQSLALSRDGQLLAAGSEDRLAQLWHFPSGEEISAPDVPAYPAECVAFSPDGQLLATGGWGSAIYLWQVEGKGLVRRQALTTRFVQSLSFSPDGALLAAGCYDGMVRLWRTEDGEAVQTLEVHNSFVLSVAFSPDGALLATGGGSTTVRLWQVQDGQPLHNLQGHTSYVRCAAFSPDGTLLATGGEDKHVRVWDVATGEALHQLKGHSDAITSLHFSPCGTRLISTSRDGTIRVWSV
ncbi:MAG: serine/threonine protein kinase [Chloroflexaceae bacterium]|nr:serine/threonine protein kinase [Chloroflexaceae bacterium]